MLIVNFKTYKQGEEVVKLAKIVEKISRKIIIVLQATDIYGVRQETGLEIFSQHVDYFEVGRNTGYILPETVKEAGASGTFLNHSEHKLSFNILEKTLKRCKKLGLKTLVFVKSLQEAKKVSKLKPAYIVFEPPELIAGKISVSEAKPDLVKKIVKNVKGNILIGAGIKNRRDVEIAKKLGAKGVVVSFIVTTSKNPEKILKELL